MAEWKSITVREAITEIIDDRIALPVIQRRLEWPDYKMEMLFDSLFKQNSFGSIICIEEEKDSVPLFAHRLFTKDGKNTSSSQVEKISHTMLLIIDGQQRLQSFYIGLCGTYNGKTLYYDLFSSYKEREYGFRFAYSGDDLSKKNTERSSSSIAECLWYPAPVLFSELKRLENTAVLTDKISNEHAVTDPQKKKCIEKNLDDFYARIFGDKSIGISKVTARMSEDIIKDRQRITELFRRLNFEGMKLSTYDLAASSLKSFDFNMENFLDTVTEEYSGIGIDQDVLIKLILILHNRPASGITELKDDDAKFAADKRIRISSTLKALERFLQLSDNLKWFETDKKSLIKKSAIPLYFLAYHIFYQNCSDEKIPELFDRYELGKSANSMSS